jgi:hypothetical protein
MNEQQITINSELSSENIRDLRMTLLNPADLTAYREALIDQYNLRNITLVSPEGEIRRYNRFVRLWNRNLHSFFVDVEMNPVGRECENMLREATLRLVETDARNEAITADNERMRAENIRITAENVSLKADMAKIIAHSESMQKQIDELKNNISTK